MGSLNDGVVFFRCRPVLCAFLKRKVTSHSPHVTYQNDPLKKTNCSSSHKISLQATFKSYDLSKKMSGNLKFFVTKGGETKFHLNLYGSHAKAHSFAYSLMRALSDVNM